MKKILFRLSLFAMSIVLSTFYFRSVFASKGIYQYYVSSFIRHNSYTIFIVSLLIAFFTYNKAVKND